ncbi:MAG: hypothetical protein PHV30_09940 [Candidatus Margulisbacteria bacterium]|nr:hypothetical protein [Candidatus Margulisiibacteriota bacterium]
MVKYKICGVQVEQITNLGIKHLQFFPPKVNLQKLSDGYEQVALCIRLKAWDSFVELKVVPPKGTSDGFHEALDSNDKQIAIKNTEILWNKVILELQNNTERGIDILKTPEALCEYVDNIGGWREFGAQAALAVREMIFKVSAVYQLESLEKVKHDTYKRHGGLNEMAFVPPQSVMLSAGKHGNGIKELETKNPWDVSVSKTIKGLPWQEWMIQIPAAKTPQMLEEALSKFHSLLYKMLAEKNDPVQKLSKEGGMTVNNTRTPFEIISLYKEAVKLLGRALGSNLELGKHITLAIDGACTETYFPEKYVYSVYHINPLMKILGNNEKIEIDETNKVLKLNREQQYRYTEHVKESKGYVFDYHTEGRYHIVLSDIETAGFKQFLSVSARPLAESKGLNINDAELELQEIADDEINKDGYKKFALTSAQQALLMRHIIDLTNENGVVFSSIEDLMSEDDWYGWSVASMLLSDVQLVGDDWWVTNPARMVRAYRMGIFNAVPLIKENQVADPFKSILMIALSENVQYLIKNGEQNFVSTTVNKSEYADCNSLPVIKQLIAELHEKVKEIGLPEEAVVAAVVSHRSKSFGPDVDVTLGLATSSTQKIGAFGDPMAILEWNANIQPNVASLFTRLLKYRYNRQAVESGWVKFIPGLVPGSSYSNQEKQGRGI